MTLEQRFTLLLEGLDFSEGEIDSLWKDLQKHYSSKSRKYHNEEHLKQMFCLYDIYKKQMQNPIEVALSIFYHDIIYSISSKENEEKSADFAMTVFKNKNVDRDIIKGLILATKMHDSKTEDEKWMVDFDLSILGQDWAAYQIYSEKIRKEYRLYPN